MSATRVLLAGGVPSRMPGVPFRFLPLSELSLNDRTSGTPSPCCPEDKQIWL